MVDVAHTKKDYFIVNLSIDVLGYVPKNFKESLLF